MRKSKQRFKTPKHVVRLASAIEVERERIESELHMAGSAEATTREQKAYMLGAMAGLERAGDMVRLYGEPWDKDVVVVVAD